MERAKHDQFDWIAAITAASGFAGLLHAKTIDLGLYEIGASVGALLAVANARGWKVGGLEPSRAAVAVAREHYQLTIEAGDLFALQRIELPVITTVSA